MAEKQDQKPKHDFRLDLLYFIVVISAVLVMQDLWSGSGHIKTIPYSEYRQLLAKDAITDVVVGETTITGAYKKPAKDGPQHFTTVRVDPAVAGELERQKVKFSGEPPPGILESVVSWFLPMIGFILIWMFLFRPMMGGGMSGGLMAVGRSKARVFGEQDVEVRFSDVAGVDEAKDELAEVVGFLKNPAAFGRLGARVPKGILLVGPPGTGKTLLARAVAGEAGVSFFSITGSEFVEMFVGVGASRVRDLFSNARKQAPAIIFIDELDALGRARGIDNPMGGHEEKEQTLNQLLAEMDGFDPSVGIIVLAATNRPEVLDPALMRAGRFDRQVLVDRPDREGRTAILKVHLTNIRAAANLDVETIAAMTPGFTGADLANLVNEAALVATRRNAIETTLSDFTQAVERIVAGSEKKSRILGAKEREIVAHHEMGHTLVALALPGTDPVQKVSIIPRGLGALGYTMQRPINMVWSERGVDASITGVGEALAGLGNEAASDLATALAPYMAGGTYGAFFEGQASLDLDTDFTVFEMSDLATREELRSVVLSAIMFMTSQAMTRSPRSVRKLLLIDEAWSMLKGGSMGEFVETYARTCRKYGGALATATQSLNDYYKSDGATAALENSDWMLILQQKPETIADFKASKRLDMDDRTETLIRSLKRSGSDYSEVFIKGPETEAIGRLVLDDYSATLFSSSPQTFAAIDAEIARGHQLADAIERIAFANRT